MKETEARQILAVDDSSTNIVLLQGILEEYGYRVITASSATEALAILETLHPALVLLDINMPHINGFQTIERIKKNEKISTIPIMIISARDDEKSRKMALSLGAIDYITKPIEIKILIDKVKAILH